MNDLDVIREAFEAWNRGDVDYWVEHSHPQVEIWSVYAALDQAGRPYRGHEGIREWRAEIDSNFESHQVRVDELRTVGDSVLVLGRVRFRGKSSRNEMAHPFGWVCEMRDGKLLRMRFFSSHSEAIEAAGLAH